MDWSLSQCLVKVREEIERVFSPLPACIDSGVRVDFAAAWLDDRPPAGKKNYQ